MHTSTKEFERLKDALRKRFPASPDRILNLGVQKLLSGASPREVGRLLLTGKLPS